MQFISVVRLFFVALALSAAMVPGINTAFARHGADDRANHDANDAVDNDNDDLPGHH